MMKAAQQVATLVFLCSTVTSVSGASHESCSASAPAIVMADRMAASFGNPTMCGTTTKGPVTTAGATTKAATTVAATTAAATTVAPTTAAATTVAATTPKPKLHKCPTTAPPPAPTTTTNSSSTTSTSTTTATTTNTTQDKRTSAPTATTTNTTTTTATSTTTNTTTTTYTLSTTTNPNTTATTLTTTNTTTTTSTTTVTATTTNTTVTTKITPTTTNSTSITTTTVTTITTICADVTAAPTTTAPKTTTAKLTTTKLITTTKLTTTPKPEVPTCNSNVTAVKTGCSADCVQSSQISAYTCDCSHWKHKSNQSACPVHPKLIPCMGKTAAFTCNVPGGVPDFVEKNGVTCKVCSSSTSVTDLDDRTGSISLYPTWGPLMAKAGGLNEVSTGVNSYSVWYVDADGRKLSRAARKMAKKTDATCCQADMYNAKVSGTVDAKAKHLMIVPNYLTGIGDNETDLPMGALIAIVDVAGGSLTVVKGSFVIAVKDVEAAMQNPELLDALAAGVAAQAKVNKELVEITGLEKVVATRRLGDTAGRRLTAGSVKVLYTILIPSSMAATMNAANIVTAMASTDGLMAEITKAIVAEGVTGVEVTGVSGATAAEEVLAPTDPIPEGSAGGARRQSPVGVLAALVLALGLLGMLN